jgi:hypothetical protein
MENPSSFIQESMRTTARKLMLTAFVASFFASPLLAQDATTDTRGVVTFGVKAGLNYANVWDEKGQDFEADPKVGFAGGAFIGIPFTDLIGLQPEILISQKGFQGSGSLLGQPYSFSKTSTFLDIPIFLELKPSKFVSIVLGPQYSYLLQEKRTYTIGSISNEQESEFAKDDMRKSLFGFVFGADLNLEHFVISGRAGWDFLANHSDGSSSTPRYKNQWLQFTLGYKI